MEPSAAPLLSLLPEEVRARTRVLSDGEPKKRPYVLYWMRVAVRDHENPALDAAVAAANALDASVLVYHGVSERYPFASDRHHTFILEGARDVARGLRRRGIAYALHVERPGARGPVLRALAEAAALVVTEDAPVPPLSGWTRRLAVHLAAKGVLFLAVDASCVVPMPLVGKRYDRAFAFRNDTRRLAAESLARPWRDVEPSKALPGWSATPEDARRRLVALNHRYALDGRDPSSYGGLYWCLGLFDRPFTPERPVLGTIRGRPTAAHATRLDQEAYAARARRPTRRVGRVAIVGAGLAGLACARTLHDHNVDVVVFDKGRAPGGRLATRRTAELTVDLGAQYFTVSDPRFERFVASWRDDGIVAPWAGRVRAVDGRGGPIVDTEPMERLVGTPSMSAIARHLARDLDVRVGHRVDHVSRCGAPFVLHGTVAPTGTTLGVRDADGAPAEPASLAELGAFDVIVLCLPPAQARALLQRVQRVSEPLAERLGQVRFDPCVALGFTTDDAALRAAPFDGLFVGRDGDPDRILGWVARDSSKPMRSDGEAWVLHAAPEWSGAHLGDAPERIERALLDALARALGTGPVRAEASTLQRWRFARAPSPLERPLFDDEARIGVGGDWAAGGRVEGAFLSGVALAGRVLGLPEPA